MIAKLMLFVRKSESLGPESDGQSSEIGTERLVRRQLAFKLQCVATVIFSSLFMSVNLLLLST